MEGKELQVAGGHSLTTSMVEPGEIIKAIKHVQRLMKDAMTPAVIDGGKIIKDGDYGLIPGCGDKPALRKSGAEILLIGFGLVAHMRSPQFSSLPGNHREVIIETEIRHASTGVLHAVGIGSASTMESKYRWRNSERTCPACGNPTIIKGKAEYGGGWLCFAKRGGCNAKFKDGAPEIESQPVGREENPDIADVYNTVLKIAAKRSAVDGTIKATGASGMFTQDVDDLPEVPPLQQSPHADKDSVAKPFKCSLSGKLAPAFCPHCPLKNNADCPNAAPPAETLPDAMAVIDSLPGADAVLLWSEENLEGFRAELNTTDFQKLESYIRQVVDMHVERGNA
jgi:hypothetical protein